ncbi:MAG: 2-hydroxyacid dehydrogenase [Clostridiales bacterium]|nr:2-hydroxyacid dehydrogenase [Clostridiales bacterium]
MKILFYGARDYDHLYFDPLAAEGDGDCAIDFQPANLDEHTAALARGYEAVCIFVNADCGREVLDILAEAGVKLVLLRCAGYNNVDVKAAKELGIAVLRVPGYSPEAVAEFAMALALAGCRHIHKAYIRVRNNNFALDGLLGRNLHGGTAGVVGTGRIGAAMARICHGFGMEVLGCDSWHNPALEGLVTYVGLEELLRRSDLVSLHCPLTEDNYHMLNGETLGWMKDTAVLVNTSRGQLIDTDALLDQLRRHRFGAVGLDVYENEEEQVFEDLSDDILANDKVALLLSYPNVIVTSHQAFFTHTALRAIAETTLENARAFQRGGVLENRVE